MSSGKNVCGRTSVWTAECKIWAGQLSDIFSCGQKGEMCECLQDGKQYSSANNILWQTISSRSSFILPPASQNYIWESNIEISFILYNCTILMYMSNSRDPPPPIQINHRSRIFKYTNKILLTIIQTRFYCGDQIKRNHWQLSNSRSSSLFWF